MKTLMKQWTIPLFILFMSVSLLANCNVTSNNTNDQISKAELGYAPAQYNLGNMYHKGEGVAQDYKEAAKWYRKASEQGLAAAQYNLGCMYYDGQGVTQNYKEAVKWYRYRFSLPTT